MLTILAVARVLLLQLAAGSATAAAVDQGSLEPSAPREAQVEAGVEHAWTVALEPGQAYQFGVEQLGTDLTVTWAVGDKQHTANEWRGRSGRETLFWVSGASAEIATATVRSATSRPARYRVLLEPPRPATSADRDRHEAERAFATRDLALRRAAIERFAVLGLEERRIWALDRLSYLASSLGEAGLARKAAEECVATARAAALEARLASCLSALGSSALEDGDIESADRAFREALELHERQGDPGPIATTLNDSTNVLLHQGDYEQAGSRLRRALELMREAGHEIGEVVVQSQLGVLASYRGELESALEAFRRGAELAHRNGSVDLEARLTTNLGLAYGQLGDIQRSIARLREAAALADATGLQPVLALAHMALGAEYEDAGDLPASARELQAAIALAKQIGDSENESFGQGQLAWTLARQGRVAAAEEQALEALASARASGSQLALATASFNLGRVRLRLGRSQSAELPLLEAQAGFTRMGRIDDQGRAWTALARYSLAAGDLALAHERATQALTVFESVRARVALADQRARYFALKRDAYDVAVEILLERERREPGQGHEPQAFEMSARARARSVLEELAHRRASGLTPVPAGLTSRRRAALDRIGHLQRELVRRHTSAKPDGEALARLERELEAALANEEAAQRDIRAVSPPRRGEAPGLSAGELRLRLAPDEVLLQYHVAEKRSWLFALSGRRLQVATLPGEAELRWQVDALRQLLARPARLGAPAYGAAARRLFATLLAPAAAQLAGARQLRIVPDGPLWEIPFEALVGEAPAGAAGFAELPYVVRRFSVSYLPSASGLGAFEERPWQTGAPELVAFADPDFAGGGPAGSPLAELERAVFGEGERWSFSRLACARREAGDAAALFGTARSRVHVGAGALESRVKSDPDVAQARYLLFATHALLSETQPSQSALLLSAGNGRQEDGLLQVREIDSLDLAAELVVLSACESALGPNLRGEGLLGLARAFFHAGARALVASLWKVADCSTAELSTELFRQLGKTGTRISPAVALRHAKLRLLGQRAYAHPYYWAPFVLIGPSPGP